MPAGVACGSRAAAPQSRDQRSCRHILSHLPVLLHRVRQRTPPAAEPWLAATVTCHSSPLRVGLMPCLHLLKGHQAFFFLRSAIYSIFKTGIIELQVAWADACAALCLCCRSDIMHMPGPEGTTRRVCQVDAPVQQRLSFRAPIARLLKAVK